MVTSKNYILFNLKLSFRYLVRIIKTTHAMHSIPHKIVKNADVYRFSTKGPTHVIFSTNRSHPGIWCFAQIFRQVLLLDEPTKL